MADRNFASRKASRRIDNANRLIIELIRRSSTQPQTGEPVTIMLKQGATEDEAEKLSAMLNLLGVELQTGPSK